MKVSSPHRLRRARQRVQHTLARRLGVGQQRHRDVAEQRAPGAAQRLRHAARIGHREAQVELRVGVLIDAHRDHHQPPRPRRRLRIARAAQFQRRPFGEQRAVVGVEPGGDAVRPRIERHLDLRLAGAGLGSRGDAVVHHHVERPQAQPPVLREEGQAQRRRLRRQRRRVPGERRALALRRHRADGAALQHRQPPDPRAHVTELGKTLARRRRVPGDARLHHRRGVERAVGLGEARPFRRLRPPVVEVHADQLLPALWRVIEQPLGRPQHPTPPVGVQEQRRALGDRPAGEVVPADRPVTERRDGDAADDGQPPHRARGRRGVQQPPARVEQPQMVVGADQEHLVARRDGEAAREFAITEPQRRLAKRQTVEVAPVGERKPRALGARRGEAGHVGRRRFQPPPAGIEDQRRPVRAELHAHAQPVRRGGERDAGVAEIPARRPWRKRQRALRPDPSPAGIRRGEGHAARRQRQQMGDRVARGRDVGRRPEAEIGPAADDEGLRALRHHHTPRAAA
jgi:hypothetical protein